MMEFHPYAAYTRNFQRRASMKSNETNESSTQEKQKKPAGLKRAYSVTDVLTAKFNTLEFDGFWKDAIGCPELAGTWFIYGDVKNGKTTLAMMLAKYLTNFGRAAYDSVEEGLSQSIQDAYKRLKMAEVRGKFLLLGKESVEEVAARLRKRKSPDFIFIDTVQFLDLKFSEYKALKAEFPNKIFIYLSHVDGKLPDGSTAKRIWRDANVAILVKGFKAFPTGRYGGGSPITICEEKAAEYWGLEVAV